jgi:hypothetical protein
MKSPILVIFALATAIHPQTLRYGAVQEYLLFESPASRQCREGSEEAMSKQDTADVIANL